MKRIDLLGDVRMFSPASDHLSRKARPIDLCQAIQQLELCVLEL